MLVNLNPAYQASELKYCLNKVLILSVPSYVTVKPTQYVTGIQVMPVPSHVTGTVGLLFDCSVPHIKNYFPSISEDF